MEFTVLVDVEELVEPESDAQPDRMSEWTSHLVESMLWTHGTELEEVVDVVLEVLFACQ